MTATMDRWLGTDGATRDTRLAGALFIALGAAFLAGIMLAASMAPGYDYQTAAISDLGVIGATAALFNPLLIVVGALNMAGGYLFYRGHRRPWLLAIYLVGGVGAIGAGVNPLSTGDVHSLFALGAFLFFNIEAIGSATVTAGPMKGISLVAGALGLVYTVIMLVGDGGNPAAFGPIGHGGSERMIVYPVMLWLLAFGGYLLSNVTEKAGRAPVADSPDLPVGRPMGDRRLTSSSTSSRV